MSSQTELISNLLNHIKSAERPGDYCFSRLQLHNGWELSIQGSEFNYSEPRERLSSLSQYTEWEVAVFHSNEMINLTPLVHEGYRFDDVLAYVRLPELIALTMYVDKL